MSIKNLRRRLHKLFDACLYFFILFFVLPDHAQAQTQTNGLSIPSAQTMVANIGLAIPNLTSFVTALAYVIGFVLVIRGIMQLKHMGEMRTQMSHEHHLSRPLTMIIVGALLIYLPSAVQTGLSTFWAEPNPYGYLTQSDQWQQTINVCFSIIQFIGVVAFIRGLVMMSKVGHGHQGSLVRAVTHIIGGIFCINLYDFIQMVFATLGIQST